MIPEEDARGVEKHIRIGRMNSAMRAGTYEIWLSADVAKPRQKHYFALNAKNTNVVLETATKSKVIPNTNCVLPAITANRTRKVNMNIWQIDFGSVDGCNHIL